MRDTNRNGTGGPRRGPARHGRLNAFQAILILAATGSAWRPLTIAGQTNSVPKPPANRWLLIVDTSRAMQSRAEPTRIIAANLIWTGMNGQMHDGDTLGVWTFNSALHTGHFPLQTWTSDTRRTVAERFIEFMQKQRFKGKSRLEPVMPGLLSVVTNSDYITVILFSDGFNEIRGTPFDRRINAVYRTWRKQQRKTQLPFVTVLRAEHGRITDSLVDTPPWPTQLPPLPAALRPPGTLEQKAIRPVPKTKPVMAPPLIIHGSGRQETPAPGTIEPPTNTPHATRSDAAGTVSAEVTAVQRPSSSTGAGPSVSRAEPTAVANRTLIATEPNAALVNHPRPETPPEAASTTPAASIKKPAEAGSNPDRAAPALKALPTPSAASQPAVSAEVETAESASTSGPETGVAVAESVPAVRPTGRSDNRILLLGIIALVLAGAALSIVILVVRRARTSSGTSLITRSLDRK